MTPRAITLVIAIVLLGAGFAAFVLAVGEPGSDWGRHVSDDSTGGGAGPARAGRDDDAPWSRGADGGVGRAGGRPTGASAGGEAGPVAGDADGGGDAGDGGGAVDPAEAEWSDRTAESMRKLVRDLEYSKGLPEPPQQVAQPQPDPWRPDPSREGPPPEIAVVTPPRGRVAGGERVEIRGRNLRVVTVMFGTAPARLLQATGELVAVEAPAGAPGPVTVVVTNEDGTWGAAGEPYVYGE